MKRKWTISVSTLHSKYTSSERWASRGRHRASLELAFSARRQESLCYLSYWISRIHLGCSLEGMGHETDCQPMIDAGTAPVQCRAGVSDAGPTLYRRCDHRPASGSLFYWWSPFIPLLYYITLVALYMVSYMDLHNWSCFQSRSGIKVSSI